MFATDCKQQKTDFMQNALSADEECAQVLGMWDLRGHEFKRILRASGITIKEFGARHGRSPSTIRLYFDKTRVKSVWRDRLMLAVGDEFYFRELLAMREENGYANDVLREHVKALNKRRQKRPIEVVKNARR